jgi:hypothetical protein
MFLSGAKTNLRPMPYPLLQDGYARKYQYRDALFRTAHAPAPSPPGDPPPAGRMEKRKEGEDVIRIGELCIAIGL